MAAMVETMIEKGCPVRFTAFFERVAGPVNRLHDDDPADDGSEDAAVQKAQILLSQILIDVEKRRK
jgi:hypothetical protein